MTRARPDVDVILLAAGRSRRMGGPDKLLLPVAGEPMLRRSVRLYAALCLPVTVVVSTSDAATTLAGLAVTQLTNPDPFGDQLSSLRLGLAANRRAGDGVLIALADQPWLTADDIAALIASFARHRATRIIIPRHLGRRGNPVLFPAAIARKFRDDPLANPRQFIDSNPALVVWHDSVHDHYTRDIDTPEDAAQLENIA